MAPLATPMLSGDILGPGGHHVGDPCCERFK